MTNNPRLLTGRRKLDLDDYRMMDLPNSLWGARFADVPAPVSALIHEYLVGICKHVGTGHGLLLSGPRHTGKSLTAAVIAKEAMRRGFSVYWTRVSDLRRDLRAKRIIPINDGTPVLERCYEVGLLVLDDLRAEDARDFVLSVRDIEDLVTGRASRHRATILTTMLAGPQMERALPDFLLATAAVLRTVLMAEGGDPSTSPSPAPVSPPPRPGGLPEGLSPEAARRFEAARLMDEEDT